MVYINTILISILLVLQVYDRLIKYIRNRKKIKYSEDTVKIVKKEIIATSFKNPMAGKKRVKYNFTEFQNQHSGLLEPMAAERGDVK